MCDTNKKIFIARSKSLPDLLKEKSAIKCNKCKNNQLNRNMVCPCTDDVYPKINTNSHTNIKIFKTQSSINVFNT